MSKAINYYKECPGSGRELTVRYIIFFEEQKNGRWTLDSLTTIISVILANKISF